MLVLRNRLVVRPSKVFVAFAFPPALVNVQVDCRQAVRGRIKAGHLCAVCCCKVSCTHNSTLTLRPDFLTVVLSLFLSLSLMRTRLVTQLVGQSSPSLSTVNRSCRSKGTTSRISAAVAFPVQTSRVAPTSKPPSGKRSMLMDAGSPKDPRPPARPAVRASALIYLFGFFVLWCQSLSGWRCSAEDVVCADSQWVALASVASVALPRPASPPPDSFGPPHTNTVLNVYKITDSSKKSLISIRQHTDTSRK